MKISLCVTIFNEEKSIGRLLDSLLVQTKRADEIVIVDGGSGDRTVEIIKHYQKKNRHIRLLIEKCSRAKGRNLGIEIAKNEIIAITDAGCIADPNWLKNLTEPFINHEIEVVAGFYKMTANNSLQKAMTIFLGILPSKFNVGFLPSTRSIAFKKSIWEMVGGFPENIDGAAEDTVFNYKLIKNKTKIARVKNAVVEWGMSETLEDFYLKIREYSKGDAKTKIWNFPGKGIMSHNIKSLFILCRYLVGLSLLILSFKFSHLLPILISLFLIYLFWSFRKVFLEYREVKTAIWGPIIQITSDLAVISGFLSGILGR